MSESKSNAYSHTQGLSNNSGATAAVVDMLTAACSAGDDTHKTQILNWGLEDDNIKKLRDKIKESAKNI